MYSTGAPGHRLSAFLFLNFYRYFQFKILCGISHTNFQNPLYLGFPGQIFSCYFRAPGPGLASWGAQRLQRVCARRCAVLGNTRNTSTPAVLKYTRWCIRDCRAHRPACTRLLHSSSSERSSAHGGTAATACSARCRCVRIILVIHPC
jgi:hypothetical protein